MHKYRTTFHRFHHERNQVTVEQFVTTHFTTELDFDHLYESEEIEEFESVAWTALWAANVDSYGLTFSSWLSSGYYIEE